MEAFAWSRSGFGVPEALESSGEAMRFVGEELQDDPELLERALGCLASRS